MAFIGLHRLSNSAKILAASESGSGGLNQGGNLTRFQPRKYHCELPKYDDIDISLFEVRFVVHLFQNSAEVENRQLAASLAPTRSAQTSNH